MLIKKFFVEIDKRWNAQTPARQRLSIIGCGALLLRTDYRRGTKDSDVFETTSLTPDVRDQLLRIAGEGSDLHQSWRHYVEIVRNGIPFLPRAPIWHPVVEINRELKHLELFALDVLDVVVSKLKRFHANDQADIDAMVQRGRVPHERFLERFRSAVDEFAHEARGDDLRKYIYNLHRVERDMLGVDETEIELPPWI